MKNDRDYEFWKRKFSDKQHRKVRVADLETGKIYSSMKDMAEALGVDQKLLYYKNGKMKERIQRVVEPSTKNTKRCIRCEEIKKLDQFHNSSSAKDGKQSRCKCCRKEYNVETNAKFNPKREDRYKRKYGLPSSCVYGFKIGKEVIYIGQSALTNARINLHYKGVSRSSLCNKATKDELRKSEVVVFNQDLSDEDRLYVERELIQAFQPKYNINEKNI